MSHGRHGCKPGGFNRRVGTDQQQQYRLDTWPQRPMIFRQGYRPYVPEKSRCEYFYSTYDPENESVPSKKKKVIILGGGQTRLKLALPLEKAGVTIWGTSPNSIDLAEDRDRFSAPLEELNIPHPQYGTATSVKQALDVLPKIYYYRPQHNRLLAHPKGWLFWKWFAHRLIAIILPA